jgi:hypothetical protein
MTPGVQLVAADDFVQLLRVSITLHSMIFIMFESLAITLFPVLFLIVLFGEEFENYCRRVRRYL